MTKARSLLLFAGISFALLPVLSQSPTKAGKQDPRANHARPSQSDDSDRGQKVFRQNCARCHDAPQGFSPQISGTVLRHMRVRASLSAADEAALLRFLNP
ncbi:MAG TPA: cytochrome c [Terracidiphilus sp.]|nr:cytochrome c [Terracidiphilus sp.]